MRYMPSFIEPHNHVGGRQADTVLISQMGRLRPERWGLAKVTQPEGGRVVLKPQPSDCKALSMQTGWCLLFALNCSALLEVETMNLSLTLSLSLSPPSYLSLLLNKACKKRPLGSSHCGSEGTNLTSIMRMQVHSLASLSGLWIRHCCEL